MFRYDGIFKVNVRRRIADESGVVRLRRVEAGEIRATSRKAAKREAERRFGPLCEVGHPTVAFAAASKSWATSMKRFLRRGKPGDTAPVNLTELQKAVRRETRDLSRNSGPANQRKELSAAEKKNRARKNRAASRQRKANARRGA